MCIRDSFINGLLGAFARAQSKEQPDGSAS